MPAVKTLMNKVAIAVIVAAVIVCAGVGAAVMINNSGTDDGGVKGSVIYHGNGGKDSGGAETVTSATDKVSPNLFIRDGYSFVSWNTAGDGSGKTYVSGDTVDLKSGQTVNLYAIWKEIKHKITATLPLIENIQFYYGDAKIDYVGTDIPDSGPITVKVKAPEGATDIKVEAETSSSGSSYQKVQYNLKSEDGTTETYIHHIGVYLDNINCVTTAQVTDGVVEITVNYEDKDISIMYTTSKKTA